MKPEHIKGLRLKEIRRIRKRAGEIRKQQRKLGYIQLPKPIRHGWYKELVITVQINRYKNEKYILEVYDCIEKVVWGKTKEEATHKWLEQTSKYLINKELPTLSKRQYNRLSDGAKRLCVPFQYYTEKKKIRTRFYVNIPKGAYRIKHTRAYITHRKRIDPLLESEGDWLAQQLYKKGYYELSHKGESWKHDWWGVSKTKRERLLSKRMKHQLQRYSIVEIINNEIDPSWERN